MEHPVLIDSNVYIDFLKLRLDPLKELGRRFGSVDIACCGIVKAEVLRGIKHPKLRDGLQRFFALTQMIGTSDSLWEETWRLAWQLDRRGKILPLPDLVIACCARRAGAAVMTRDQHFREIPDLQVIEP